MDLFAHRIHRCTYVNGIMRLDFSTLSPDKDGKVDPEQEVPVGEESFTVNIPLGGFMRSMGTMRETMQMLAEQGVLKGGPGGEGGPGGGDGGGRIDPMKKRKQFKDLTQSDDDDDQVV
ncbi:MAG: hypothetical protein AAGK33_09855 [Pseudomonadota bacterium]